MKVYNYKLHALLSIITSCIMGGIAWFIIKPTMFPTMISELISQDSGQIVMREITYGYEAVITIFVISLIIMMVLYKPVKKIADKQINGTSSL